MYNDALYKSIS